MYKDVWKKFGVKVLIVLCSVMLLGGIAVVAPKISANESDGTMGESGTPPENGLGEMAALPDSGDETVSDNTVSDNTMLDDEQGGAGDGITAVDPEEETDPGEEENPSGDPEDDPSNEPVDDTDSGETVEPDQKKDPVVNDIEPDDVQAADDLGDAQNQEIMPIDGTIELTRENTFLAFTNNAEQEKINIAGITDLSSYVPKCTYKNKKIEKVYVYYRSGSDVLCLGEASDRSGVYDLQRREHIDRDNNSLDGSNKEVDAGLVTYVFKQHSGYSGDYTISNELELPYQILPKKVENVDIIDLDNNDDPIKYTMCQGEATLQLKSNNYSVVINNRTEEVDESNYKNFTCVPPATIPSGYFTGTRDDGKITWGNNYCITDDPDKESVGETSTFEYSVKREFSERTIRITPTSRTYTGVPSASAQPVYTVREVSVTGGNVNNTVTCRPINIKYLDRVNKSTAENNPSYSLMGTGQYDNAIIEVRDSISPLSIAADSGTLSNAFTFENGFDSGITFNSSDTPNYDIVVPYDSNRKYELPNPVLKWDRETDPLKRAQTKDEENKINYRGEGDYYLTFEPVDPNKDCGDIRMTIEGQGCFAGSVYTTYYVEKPITECNEETASITLEYNGQERKTASDMGIHVYGTKNHNVELNKDDYDIEIKDINDKVLDSIKDRGLYSVTITPKEHKGFSGKLVRTVEIKPFNVTGKWEIVYKSTNGVFPFTDGKGTADAILEDIKIVPIGQISAPEWPIRKDTDYTPYFGGVENRVVLDNGNEQTLKIDFDKGTNSNYTGSLETTFILQETTFNPDTFKIDFGSKTYTYNGTVQVPKKGDFKITYPFGNGRKEVPADAYDIVQDDEVYNTHNINASSDARIKITAKENGGYHGSLEFKFEIKPLSLYDGSVVEKKLKSVPYNGKRTEPELSIIILDADKNEIEVTVTKNDYNIENVQPIAQGDFEFGKDGYPKFGSEGVELSNEYRCEVRGKGNLTTEQTDENGNVSETISMDFQISHRNAVDEDGNLDGISKSNSIVTNIPEISDLPGLSQGNSYTIEQIKAAAEQYAKDYVKAGKLGLTFGTEKLKNDTESMNHYDYKIDKTTLNNGKVEVTIGFYHHFTGKWKWVFTVGKSLVSEELTVLFKGRTWGEKEALESITIPENLASYTYSPIQSECEIPFSNDHSENQKVRLEYNGTILTNDDYELNYVVDHATQPDNPTYVEVIGKGKGYYGKIVIYYQIKQRQLTKDTVTVNVKGEWRYTGSQIMPEGDDVEVKDKKGPTKLTPGIKDSIGGDYYLEYGPNIGAGSNAGSIFVHAVPGGNYVSNPEGLEVKFEIKKYNFSEDVSGGAIEINTERKYLYYTGDPQKCQVEVRLLNLDAENPILTQGIDYRVYFPEPNESYINASSNLPVEIYGLGNFEGIYKATFTIHPVVLRENYDETDQPKVELVLTQEIQEYTGSPCKPTVQVRYPLYDSGNYKYIDSEYLEVQYRNNTEMGADATATVSVKDSGKPNFEGTQSTTFQVRYNLSRDYENARLVYRGDNLAYNEDTKRYSFPCTGSERKFDFAIEIDGRKDLIPLKEGEDYIAEYKDNINAGRASVRIEGIGRCTGERTTYFDIIAYLGEDDPNGLFKCEFVDEKYAIWDYGRPVYPKIKVTYADTPLTENVQYRINRELSKNTDITTDKENPAYIIIEPTAASSSYMHGTYKLEFPIYVDIGNMEASLERTQYEYTGKKIEPAVTVMSVSGSALTLNADYTVEYPDKIDADGVPGRVVITGREDAGYVRTKVLEFDIIPRNLQSSQVSVNVKFTNGDNMRYTGNPITPTQSELIVECTFDGSTIQLKDSDYRLYYGNNINTANGNADNPKAGPYLTVEGIGNFRGSIDKAFTILPKKISDKDISIVLKTAYSYRNGNPVTPNFKLIYNDKVLRGIEAPNQPVDESTYYRDCDYSYTVTNNINTGSIAVITIEGHGNFYDQQTASFEIVKKDIGIVKDGEEDPEDEYEEDVNAALSPEKFTYTGEECRPEVILNYLNTNILNLMLDPIVEYDRNKNITTDDRKAVVTIKANENDPNYTGTRVIEFTIDARSLKNAIECYYVIGDGESATEQNIMQHDLKFDFTGTTQRPELSRLKIYAVWRQNGEVKKVQLEESDFDIEYISDAKDEPEDQPQSYGGRVTVVVTGKGNFCEKGEFFYYIGDDISTATCTVAPATSVFNAMAQPPRESVSGVSLEKCNVVWYKGSVAESNIVKRSQIIDAATYHVQIQGVPSKGTYAKEPRSMTYTITPRTLSSNVVVDGFKREYQYTGAQICPVGISVTDYIDGVKYKLAEGAEYTLAYSNNINIGTATITVNGTGNFRGTGTGQFLITASTISSGNTLPGNSYLEGTGQISGAKPVAPSDVKLTMDTANAMYYTGSPLYPRVSISGMTENVDYTVTYSSNTEVGIGVINIAGIGNNTGTITRYFRIIASLTKCTIGSIPTQEYTGSPIKPAVVVRCGNTILKEGTDYTVTYINNTNIGTATVMIRAASNENYTGSVTTTFKIGNDMSSFLVTGYPPSVVYDGEAKVPGVIVESGNTVLTQGTDYTVSYRNNVEVGVAEIIVTGMGRYDGTQTVNFVIEARNIDACDVTEVEDKVYTGDAYTPPITVSDSGTVLQNGVDYTVTYKNNTNPGMAAIVIEPLNKNYSGTKTINFRIAGLAVDGVKASSIKHSSMKLSWSRQSYASGYQICNAQSRVVETITSNKNSATIKGLAGGTNYQYKVRSYIQNADGTRSFGAFSSVVSATTKLKTPSVNVYARKAGQARVEWKAVSGATGYEVFYKGSKNASYRKVKTINKANVRVCKIKGLKKNQKCYVKVRAFKRSGSKKIYSAKSTGQNVKIK